ncbi:MAG: hypothetical protein OEW56_14160, partial [Gemmatimonadota bacterium]|nr:hypothetical protein [Gemmatimonadota bacterium]
PGPVDAPAAPATVSEGKAATEAQKKKLNVLVGTLRDQGSITTRQLWQAVAKTRAVDVDTMIELLEGMDEDGLHYGPLRDSLNRAEASDLIDRLQKMEDAAATPVSQ